MKYVLIAILVFVQILHLIQSGSNFLMDSFLLLFAVAIPVRVAIESVVRFNALAPLKRFVVTLFQRVPFAVAYVMLVLIGGMTVWLVSFLIRNFRAPSDSWIWITMGILLGMMSSLFYHERKRLANKPRTESVARSR